MAATGAVPDEYDAQSDSLAVASKGYQQVTSWQVCLSQVPIGKWLLRTHKLVYIWNAWQNLLQTALPAVNREMLCAVLDSLSLHNA